MPADYADEVLRVAETLEGAGVDYMITGGATVAVYGSPRTTFDVDVVVLSVADKVLQALRKAGYKVIPDEVEKRFPLVTVESPDGMRVDVWFAPDIPWDRESHSRKRQAEIKGKKVWIISPEDLIARKLWRYRKEANQQDLEDVRSILIGPITLDIDHLEVSLRAMRTWSLFCELLAEAKQLKEGTTE